jgi:hypothetical protein
METKLRPEAATNRFWLAAALWTAWFIASAPTGADVLRQHPVGTKTRKIEAGQRLLMNAAAALMTSNASNAKIGRTMSLPAMD